MQKIVVVGAGFMGSGIAQVCAMHGLPVALVDPYHQALEKAMTGIKGSLERMEAKGELKGSAAEALGRISPGTELAPAAQADWVIESALERLDLKLEIFAQLDQLAHPQALLASNTSSIPITRLAQATKRPAQVLGLHFFVPVVHTQLVEVVGGEASAPEALERGAELARFLGKTPVVVRRDVPGFVMNRIFAAALSQAVDLVDQGVVSPADLDSGMRLGYGWMLGPLEIADKVGLDTCALIMKFMRSVGETKLAPQGDLVERMVAQGHLGRKSGQGFYRYDARGKRLSWRAGE